MSTPYADAAGLYYAAGWAGALPVRGKWPPPTGWTGTNGAWPSYADVQAWVDGDEGKLNIGLRLPRHVLGIDVDDYGTKTGGRTLADHEALWGPLPATWISSSRSDGVSGIRLFAIPEGLHWPGELRGGGVEIIQHKHRYVMVWPSIHPDTEQTYLWKYGPAGWHPDPSTDDQVPNPDELPNLPDAWIAGLTQGRAAEDVQKADLGDAAAAGWLAQHGTGPACPAMTRALTRCAGELLAAGASRHDAAMRGVARIAHLVSEGHTGALEALTKLHQAFGQATAGDPARASEWSRLVTGAVQIAAVHDPAGLDPCLSPFMAGHVPASPFKQQDSPFRQDAPCSTTTTTSTGPSPTSTPASPVPTAGTAPGSCSPSSPAASATSADARAGTTTAPSEAADARPTAPPQFGALALERDPFLGGRPVSDPFAAKEPSWPDSSSVASSTSAALSAGASSAGTTVTSGLAPASSMASAMPSAGSATASSSAPNPSSPDQYARDLMLAGEVEQLRVRREAKRIVDAEEGAPPESQLLIERMVPGASFVLDIPERTPAVWGENQDVLWAEGESLIIAAGNGAGKTTLAGQLVRGRLGLGMSVLGYPIQPGAKKVLYLAMDRPQQIARSLRRHFTEAERGALNERLLIWKGPPLADLARQPEMLLAMVHAAGADTVVIDSLKDAAIGLSDDDVGAGWNRARQHVIANGCQMLELHHNVKRNVNGGEPSTIADIYGSAWITAGVGSAIILVGAPGDPVVQMKHVKQPADEVGPWRLLHDHDRGVTTLFEPQSWLDIVRAYGRPVTAKDVAVKMFETESVSHAEKQKALRQLDRLAKENQLVITTHGDRATANEYALPPVFTEYRRDLA